MVPSASYLFEVSWETCNKVGGIYTVIKSKAALMNDLYSNYFLIGPYFENHASIELDQKEPPEFLKKVFNVLEKKGLKFYYGKWQIKGYPNTILIDSSSIINLKNEIKKSLWEKYRIDSLNSGWDFEEPMVWAWAVGMLLEEVKKNLQNEKIVGHFHEWLAGFASLYIDMNNIKIGTTFTTHATMLGRSLCGSGRDLYAELERINPYDEAKSQRVMDKFTTERACAQFSDVFTTVSEITGMEAEKILGRKPNVLVLNGLDMSKFPTFEEASIKHINFRDRIREFISYYFFPYYTFDLDHNLIFSIFGRYEYKNKGIDIFIKSLGLLNKKLIKENVNRTITAFFFIPAGNNGPNNEVITNKVFYRHLKDYVMRRSKDINGKIVSNLLSGKHLNEVDLFGKEFLSNTKKHMMMFRKKGLPPLSTHYIDDNDMMIKAFRENGLLNNETDKVKVVIYPIYLTGADGLLDLDYYNVISGSHLGVFPSYYEPWGYTPLESAALGVPAVTTDLAGFGRFIEKDKRTNKSGIFVLKRLERNDNDVVNDFSKLMFDFASLDRHERVKQKIDAKQLAELADWNELVFNYVKAHNLSLDKI